MNWEALGVIAEYVGVVIVITSILYLSKQIRESNKHASAEVERHAQESYNQYLESLVSDRDSLEIYRSGLASFSKLSDSDKTFFHIKASKFINHLEMVLRMESKGLISSDMVDTFGRVVITFLDSTPGGREFWEQLPVNTYQKLSTEYISRKLQKRESSLDVGEGLSYFLKFDKPDE